MSKQKNSLAPEVRFPEFKGESPWLQLKIGKHLKESRIKGSAGDKAKKLTVKLWGNGVYAKDDRLKGSENTQYYRRRSGQFIYSKLDFLNQAFGIVPEHLDGYESTVDLPCFDVSDELDVRFLLEYVQRKDFYKKFGEIADGGRKAKRIQVEAFLNFPVYIPKIEEQQKIADFLASIDELITLHTQKLEALKDHKKGLMQQLFPSEGEVVPKLRFPEFRGQGKWREVPLSSKVELISGLHLPPDGYAEVGEVPYFTGPSDYTNNIDSVSKWTKRSANIGRHGDTVITVKGSGVGELLRLELDEVALGRQLMAVRATSSHEGFVFHFLATKRQLLIALASGNLIPGLSRGDILGLRMLVPKSDREQQMVADCLTSIDEMIALQVKELDFLKYHKKGLIRKLFPIMDEVV